MIRGSDLKNQTATGVRWTGLATLLSNSLQFAQRAILAHLLIADDFGLASMTFVVVGFAQSFSDFGVSNAIIHRQTVDRKQLSSLYWLNILSGVLISGIVLGSTRALEFFFDESRLTNLLPWAALIVLISTLGQQFQTLLQKELAFRRLATIDITATLVSTGVALSSALAGKGVLALIWGQLAMTAVRALLLMATGWTRWKPTMHFRLEDLRGYIFFGLYQMGAFAVSFISNNVDYVIIGKYLGVGPLGMYTLAYQLVVVPYHKLNPVITRVAFPVLAKVQRDISKLRLGFLEMTKFLASIIFPLLVGLAIVAPVFIPVVFGPGWEAAVVLTQLLVPVGIVKALGNPIVSLLLAKGRADILFYWATFIASVNALVFLVTVQYGLTMLAFSYVCLTIFYLISWCTLLRSVVQLHFLTYLKTLFLPTTVSLSVGVILLGSFSILKQYEQLPPTAVLGFLLVVGAISSGLMNWLLQREYLKELWELLIGDRRASSLCSGE